MKKKVVSLLFAIATVFYCCTPKLLPPTDADVARGKTVWGECSLETLHQGQELYKAKCATCHSLKMPSSRNEDGWKQILPPMAKKAKLTSAEQDLILHYLLTMRDAKK